MGTRKIILARHGQYHSDPEELTDLGRAQAELLAARLSSEAIDGLISSTLPRAKETASILHRYHPGCKYQSTSLLDESIAYRPRLPASWSDLISEESLVESQQQLEGAMLRFFKSTRSALQTDLLVCHGNIIRTLVCRAMNFPLGAWSELRIHHCSLTTLLITRQRVSLLSFNDIGHLPSTLQTEI